MQAHKQYTTVRSISTKVVSGKGRELSLQTKASVEMLTKAVSFARRICSDQSHASFRSEVHVPKKDADK